MAEQVLAPEKDKGVLESDGGPLTSEIQKQDRAPGKTFGDRALEMSRGSGPHIKAGRRVERLVDTAGRLNRFNRGPRAADMTSGAAKRSQFTTARNVKGSARDMLHYRSDFGTTMSDKVHGQAVQQQQKFKKYIADTKQKLNQSAQQVQQEYKSGMANIDSSYNQGLSQLNSQYQKAMSQIPPYQDLGKSYQNWLKNDNHYVWVMSGTGPDNPGKQEAAYKLPPSQLKPFFDMLVREAGMPVYKNRIYVKGRGQEVHDQLRGAQNRNKAEYYKRMAPQIQEANSQIDRAKSQLNAQRASGMEALNFEKAKATASLNEQKAKLEGQIAGRREGLQLEVRANQEDLANIRKSYQTRLSRIDNALSALVGGGERTASRSEPTEQRQISPLRPGAQ